MRYIELIEEYNPLKFMQGPEFEHLIQKYKYEIKHALQFNDGYKGLYRGINSDHPIIVATTEGYNRKSSESYNYINMLTDKLPSWKAWPKRTKCIICTSNIENSFSFGSPYLVIPTKYGIFAKTNDIDFWRTLPVDLPFNGPNGVNAFNELLHKIILLGNEIYDIKLMDDNIPEMFLRFFDDLADKAIDDPTLTYIKHVEKHGKLLSYEEYGVLSNIKKTNALEFFNKILDPSVNCQLVQSYHTLDNYDANEVWFEGEAIFVKKEYIDLFKQAVGL
jgi:hypothetical protein